MPLPQIRLNHFSFGGTAAIVTNMALIAGLNAAQSTKSAIVGSILIVALADNITDSLSIHIYQESEHLDGQKAFVATLTNFVARLLTSLSFLGFVLFLPIEKAVYVCVAWGIFLLMVLTALLAKQRKVSVGTEIIKHLATAILVILAGKGIGYFIASQFQ